MDPEVTSQPYRTPFYGQTHLNNAKAKEYRTIIMSKETSEEIKNWRCDTCGSIVFQYYNSIKAVFQGAMNIADCEMPTDHLCKKCNIIFRVT